MRRRPVFYADTKTACLKKMRDYQAKAGRTPPSSSGALTLDDYLPRWLDSKKSTTAPLTWQGYETHVRLYLAPYLGKAKLASLDALAIETFYADMAKAGVSPEMRRKAGETLTNALAHAVYPLRLITHNPAGDVRKPRVEKKEMVCLTAMQAKWFLRGAERSRLSALFVVWLASGARGAELYALLWSDVDFAASTISLVKSLEQTRRGEPLRVKDTKTGKCRRKVVMPAFGMAALLAHKERMTKEGNYSPSHPVFCNTKGAYLRQENVWLRHFAPSVIRADRLIAEDAKARNVPCEPLPHFRPYDLRHCSASLLLLAGENVKVVSERLGHSNATLTLNTYAHVLPGMQEQAALKLEKLLG